MAANGIGGSATIAEIIAHVKTVVEQIHLLLKLTKRNARIGYATDGIVFKIQLNQGVLGVSLRFE